MGKKRTYQWLGGGQNIQPETDSGTGTDEIIQLIPAQNIANIANERTRFLIEAIYLNFSIRRILVTTFDALGFLVYQIPPQEGSQNPSLALDALSLVDRLYARKNILMMAPLPVPPLLGNTDLSGFVTDDRILTSHHEYQARRKHDTASQVLCMTVNSDVSVVTSVFCQWRILVSF